MYTLLLEYYLLIKLINLYLHDKLTVSFVNSKDPVIGFKDVSSVLSCYSNCFTKLKDRLIKTFLLAAKKPTWINATKAHKKIQPTFLGRLRKHSQLLYPLTVWSFCFPRLSAYNGLLEDGFCCYCHKRYSCVHREDSECIQIPVLKRQTMHVKTGIDSFIDCRKRGIRNMYINDRVHARLYATIIIY